MNRNGLSSVYLDKDFVQREGHSSPVWPSIYAKIMNNESTGENFVSGELSGDFEKWC